VDKGLRRYAALIERALGSWEVSPQEWADYIAFLGRLLKACVSDGQIHGVCFIDRIGVIGYTSSVEASTLLTT